MENGKYIKEEITESNSEGRVTKLTITKEIHKEEKIINDTPQSRVTLIKETIVQETVKEEIKNKDAIEDTFDEKEAEEPADKLEEVIPQTSKKKDIQIDELAKEKRDMQSIAVDTVTAVDLVSVDQNEKEVIEIPEEKTVTASDEESSKEFGQPVTETPEDRVNEVSEKDLQQVDEIETDISKVIAGSIEEVAAEFSEETTEDVSEKALSDILDEIVDKDEILLASGWNKRTIKDITDDTDTFDEVRKHDKKDKDRFFSKWKHWLSEE
jgi:hypothetical protein